MNPTQYMYLGPNRPFGLPLVTRAIFRGDPEKTFPQLSALFEQHKELRSLFVPVAELATSRMLLTMQGTALHNAYAAIKSASAKARKQ